MRKCHTVHSSRLSNVGSQDTKSFYLWLQDFRCLGDFFFFFLKKKSNQSKIKGGFLKMWISWTPQIQVYICDIQSRALNNFYSSLGNLSVESERVKRKQIKQTRFMWFSCLRILRMRNQYRLKALLGWLPYSHHCAIP